MARLPSDWVTTALISTYFSDENWSFSALDEHHFRPRYEQYQAVSSKAHVARSTVLSAIPALLFSVLAMALQFTSLESDAARALGIRTTSDCDKISLAYMQTGQEILDLLDAQKPTTASIEYHITKTMWLKNRGQGRESWQTLGIAVRQGQEIDLHQIREDGSEVDRPDVEQTLLRCWEIEHKKRLWARLFILDSHMAMALGRPRGINREDCSTSAPFDCDFPSNPSRTVPRSTRHAYEPPNSFSFIASFWIALSHKVHDILSMRASKSHLKDHTQIQSLHEAITSLVNGQPPSLRPIYPNTSWDKQMPQLPAVRERILAAAQGVILALHRPYISTHPTSLFSAMNAAFEILQAQHRLFGLVRDPQRKLYGYSFYTVDAGVFLAAIVTKHFGCDMAICSRALQQLQQATTRLCAMKDRSPIAQAGEPILRQCCYNLEVHMRTPLSTTGIGVPSNEGLSNELLSFLQDMSSSVPDESARQLLATLADLFTPASLPTGPGSPPDGSFNQYDPGLLSLVNNEGYTNSF